MDRRFRSGHPWVYSNELLESPKGISPGDPIRLQDAGGQPLALGYGNPKSLIAFRALARGSEAVKIGDPFAPQFLLNRLKSALWLRVRSGLSGASFRLCFGEADFLPGLVIDRYLLEDGQAFVVQAHTAGADRMLPAIAEALETLCSELPGGPSWDRSAIVFRNDLGVRALEGLKSEFSSEERVHRALRGVDLSRTSIKVIPALRESANPIKFLADLVTGQKTGFFLDQAYNVSLAARNFAALAQSGEGEIRILDLCSYVGQWSTQLAHAFSAGRPSPRIRVTAVDASQAALELARENIAAAAPEAEIQLIKGDVLKDLAQLEEHSFDLVVCDPPALIKSRKDIPAGKHAYLQLNTQVFRLVRPGGGVVSCSCSGLLEEEDFLATLSKAAYRNSASMRWVARGSQAPDHPMLAEFPEGRYLKCWQGWA